MTTAPARICECLALPVVRDGEPTEESIVLDFDTETGRLILFSDWSERRQDWRCVVIYRVLPFIADDEFCGSAFRLVKEAGECYDLLMSDNGSEFDQCDCRGWLAWGHCKHVSAMRWLNDEGYLSYGRVSTRMQ